MSQSEGNMRHVTASATGPRVGRNGAAFDLEPALKPEEDEADQRYEDVAPEDDADIARLEIVLGDHRMDVGSGGAPEKGGDAQDGGETHFEAPPCCNDTDQSQAQVREAEFDLERAVRPADEARGHLVEDDVGERIIDVGDADREKEEPLEQRLDRKSTRLNSSHLGISYAVFCLKKK